MLESAAAQAEQTPSEAAQTKTHRIHLAVFAPATAVIILGIEESGSDSAFLSPKAVSAENHIAGC